MESILIEGGVQKIEMSDERLAKLIRDICSGHLFAHRTEQFPGLTRKSIP